MKIEISSEVIEDKAYQNNTEITEVVLNEGVKVIGNYAFYKCTNLTKITFPQSLEVIGDYAFKGCSTLTVVHNYIEETEVKIGYYREALEGEKATHVIDRRYYQNLDGEEEYEDYYREAKTGEVAEYIWINEYAEGIRRDSNIEYLGTGAFYGVNLGNSHIVFGSKLKHIGDESFRGVTCKNAYIVFMSPITIGRYAFYESSLDGVVPQVHNTKSIQDHAFAKAKNASIPIDLMPENSVIEKYAFYNCSFVSLWPSFSLTHVTSIGDYAFSESNITNIKIIKANTLGKGAFLNCKYLTEVLLSPNILKIERDTFVGCCRFRRNDSGSDVQIPVSEGGITLNCSMHTVVPYIKFASFDYNTTRLATIIVPDRLTTWKTSWEEFWEESWDENGTLSYYDFEHNIKKSSDYGFFVFVVGDTLLLGQKKLEYNSKNEEYEYVNISFREWLNSSYSSLFGLPYNTYIPEYLGKVQGSLNFTIDYNVATGASLGIIYPAKDKISWVVKLPRSNTYHYLNVDTIIEPNANYGHT